MTPADRRGLAIFAGLGLALIFMQPKDRAPRQLPPVDGSYPPAPPQRTPG